MSKMDERTLTALRGSIKKWDDIVAGTGRDESSDNCPLCVEFNTDTSLCDECPVAIATGEYLCQGTPYMKWARLFHCRPLPWVAKEPQQKAAAQAELDFLRSLLPEGES